MQYSLYFSKMKYLLFLVVQKCYWYKYWITFLYRRFRLQVITDHWTPFFPSLPVWPSPSLSILYIYCPTKYLHFVNKLLDKQSIPPGLQLSNYSTFINLFVNLTHRNTSFIILAFNEILCILIYKISTAAHVFLYLFYSPILIHQTKNLWNLILKSSYYD